MSLKDPGSFEWKMMFAVTGGLDVAQWLADLVIGPGEGANEAADPIIGIGLGLYFQFRGASLIKRPSRLLSLVGGDLAEQFSASVAPAWVIDAWYIHKTVKDDWAAEQAAAAEAEAAEDENAPMNRMVNGRMMRPPQRNKPLNQGDHRGPNADIQPLPNTPTVGQSQKTEETSFSA